MTNRIDSVTSSITKPTHDDGIALGMAWGATATEQEKLWFLLATMIGPCETAAAKAVDEGDARPEVTKAMERLPIVKRTLLEQLIAIHRASYPEAVPWHADNWSDAFVDGFVSGAQQAMTGRSGQDVVASAN